MNKEITVEAKRALFNAIFVPTLCYQGQKWTLDSRIIRNINTAKVNVSDV